MAVQRKETTMNKPFMVGLILLLGLSPGASLSQTTGNKAMDARNAQYDARSLQIVASLKSQCEAQREAALDSLYAKTPEERLANGESIDRSFGQYMDHDTQKLVEVDIPDVTRRALAPRVEAQYRYTQCLLIARVRQLASDAPGVLRPDFSSPFSFGSTNKAFLIADLHQACQAEKVAVMDFERLNGRDPWPPANEGLYESAMRNDEDGTRKDRGVFLSGTKPSAINRFKGCLANARLRHIARFRDGTLIPPPYSGAIAPSGLIAGAEPGTSKAVLAARDAESLARRAPAAPAPQPATPPGQQAGGAGAGPGAGARAPTPSGIVALPRPVSGAVNAPVILGSTTNGATRTAATSRSGSTFSGAAAAPAEWKTRTLTLPPELATLKPMDAILDYWRSDNNENIWMGRNFDEAVGLGTRYNQGLQPTTLDQRSPVSCSQLLGKTTVSWFVFLNFAHQLPPQGVQMQGRFT